MRSIFLAVFYPTRENNIEKIKKMSMSQNIFSWSVQETRAARISRLRRWAGLIVLVLLFSIVMAFSAGWIKAYKVTSSSMSPTIRTGDCVIVKKIKPYTNPRRGSIVALRNPTDPSDELCKRLVGMPRDKVEVRHGHLYLNDVIQDDEPYVKNANIPVQDFSRTLGSDEYFVMGDNRDSSVDSTVFGPVHSIDFIGVMLFVYWPLDHVKTIHNDLGLKADAAEILQDVSRR